MTVICPYCNGNAELVDSAEIYNGRSYGMSYLCRPCWAYVGCHKGTNKPLGRLADADLRHWKQRAHAAFDPMWKQGNYTRNKAYAWLAEQLGLTKDECHIGMFDIYMCQKVIEVCE